MKAKSPLREPAFRLLWICVAVAFLAQWMLPTTAQWFLLDEEQGQLVTIVQVALSVPLAVLAIPVGVIADRIDRRRLVIAVQSSVLCLEAALATLAFIGALEPWSLFVLLAALACGMAATFTPLSAMVPDLVEADSVASASTLLVVASNATRVIGPAVAGVLVGVSGVPVAFAATIPATALLLVSLVRLRARSSVDREREGLFTAARTGLRYVRHSPQALKLMLRSFWFATCVMAMLSLLPLLAHGYGATSSEFGLVLAAQGVGAVIGAVTLSWCARRWTSNAVIAAGFGAGALALILASASPGLLALGGSVVVAGWAWTTVLATIQGQVQLYLPGWVRARGLSILMVATFSGQGIGAAAAGILAAQGGVRLALSVAGATMLGGALLAIVLPLKDLHGLDRSAVGAGGAPDFSVSAARNEEKMQIRIRYEVPEAERAGFIEVMMASIRLIRLRNGALRWQLLNDASETNTFYEEILVPSAPEHAEHLRRRAVASDKEAEARIARFAAESGSVRYSFRVSDRRI